MKPKTIVYIGSCKIDRHMNIKLIKDIKRKKEDGPTISLIVKPYETKWVKTKEWVCLTDLVGSNFYKVAMYTNNKDWELIKYDRLKFVFTNEAWGITIYQQTLNHRSKSKNKHIEVNKI